MKTKPVVAYRHKSPERIDEQLPLAPQDHVFYVTVRDAGRTGFLLGPFADHTEAIANIERGKGLAEQHDVWAHFYSYGTASVPSGDKQPKAIFR